MVPEALGLVPGEVEPEQGSSNYSNKTYRGLSRTRAEFLVVNFMAPASLPTTPVLHNARLKWKYINVCIGTTPFVVI